MPDSTLNNKIVACMRDDDFHDDERADNIIKLFNTSNLTNEDNRFLINELQGDINNLKQYISNVNQNRHIDPTTVDSRIQAFQDKIDPRIDLINKLSKED